VPGIEVSLADEDRNDNRSQLETGDRVFKLVLYDGLASEAMGTLTTGVFLAGYAVALGASNAAIGVIAAIPFLVQLLQLPAVVIVERWRARRTICVSASAIGRCFLLACGVAPVLGPSTGIVALIGFLAVHQAMGAIGGCAWNSWMRDLVPNTDYGRFFGRRTAATTALATTLAIIGGVVVDQWKSHFSAEPALAYSCLFVLSALIGLYGVYLLSITPDVAMPPVEKRTHPVAMLSAPFHDVNFRRLIIFLSAWSFASNLAAPFFTVYMLRSLDYPMARVLVLTIASQLSNLASLSIWGTLIDRFSNKAVLGISAPLFLFCTLAWTFTGLPWASAMTFQILFVIHMLMGISTAGVALASNNIVLKLSPRGQATAFLAANSVVSSAFAAVAPIVGGLCADFFASHELTLAFTWKGGAEELTLQVLDFHSWTFFFGIAFLIGLYSLHRLSFIEEVGGSADPLLLRQFLLEARRSVLNLSSAAGLLRVVRSPLVLLRPRAD
jgi:MFS family permease